MSTTLKKQVASEALAILSSAKRRTTHAAARAKDGSKCDALDPSAVAWDSMGAIYKAASDLAGTNGHNLADDVHSEINAISHEEHDLSLSQVHDLRGHKVARGVIKAYVDRT